MYQNISITSGPTITSGDEGWNYKSLLRKFVLSVGILSLAIVTLYLSLFGYVYFETKKLDKDSNNFVQEIVPQIAGTWDERLLYTNADEIFKEVTSREDLHKLFSYTSKKLGPFVYYQGSEGSSHVFVTFFRKDVSAQYISRVHYENGPADIIVDMIQKDGHWLIQGYRINSPVFATEVNEVESTEDILEALPSGVVTE